MSSPVATIPTPTCIAEVEHTLRLFHQDGETIEIRALGVPGRGRPHTAAGYFRDLHAAAEAAVHFEMTRKPAGLYFVLNQIDPQCFYRGADEIKDYAETTTSDRDITLRRWLYIDIDPQRPSGVSSNNRQLAAAQATAETVHDWLMAEMGMPEPIHAMSGNGWHLQFPVELPNNDESLRLIGSVLATLKQFDNDRDGVRINIDQSTKNAARICRLYGTLARKGTSTAETPHRRSQIVYVPDCIGETFKTWEGVSNGDNHDATF